MTLAIATVASPIGDLTVTLNGSCLVAVAFEGAWPDVRASLNRRFPGVDVDSGNRPAGVIAHLRRYFEGQLDALQTIDVDPGGTPFQARVWGALRDIPPGRTVSYGELARAIGAPTAVRAVGAANGANPIPIVIPCHRVIGADGRLVGYGGGLERKRWLLQHEGVRLF